MGTPISKPLFQLPELKDRIFDNIQIFRPSLRIMTQEKFQEKSVTLDVGVEESRLEVNVVSPQEALLVFSYVIDSDNDKMNGRIYWQDHFQINPTENSFENLRHVRKIVYGSGALFWHELKSSLEKDILKNPPSQRVLRQFYEQVILPFPIEIPKVQKIEQAPLPPPLKMNDSLSFDKILRETQNSIPFDFASNFQFFTTRVPDQAFSVTPESLLLARRQHTTIPLQALQVAEDQWLAFATDPANLLPFIAGASSFRFGKLITHGVLSELGFRGPMALGFAAGCGIMLEAASFEGLERWRRGQSLDGFQESFFHHVGNFALFHASGALFSKVSFNPLFNHLGSFATFHGVNEFQRSETEKMKVSHPVRIFSDLAFYLHAAAASGIAREIWGPEHPFFFVDTQKYSKKRQPEQMKVIGQDQIPTIIEIAPSQPKLRLLVRLIDGKHEMQVQERGEGVWLLEGRFEIRREEYRWTLRDLRKSNLVSRFQAPADNPKATPLRVNATAVNPGDVIYIQEGALISVGNYVHRFHVINPGRFEVEFSKQLPQFQQLWSRKLSEAEDVAALIKLLQAMNLPSAQQELRNLDTCMKGNLSVEALSPWVRSRVLHWMNEKNGEMSRHLPAGFESLLNESHPAASGTYVEQRYYISAATLDLMGRIQVAAKVEDLITAVKGSPLERFEMLSSSEVYQALVRYQQGRSAVTEMPRDFGIRQKLADIEEFNYYRKHEEGTLHPAYGQDVSLKRNCEDLKKDHEALLFRMKSIAPVKGSAKKYAFGELEELIHEVLERGKPLETIPTEKNVRKSVKEYMQSVIDVSLRMFPEEWLMARDGNYFTGEKFGAISSGERYLQTRYRFARMLLNEKSGLPIFGEPTAREQGHLVWFAKEKLKVRGDIHFADAQWAIREHLQRFSSQIQEGLRAANQEERALVMESFFGSQQHRMMTDPYKAFEVARFLGEVGFYREVGVTLEIVGKRIFTNLSLGDLGSVSSEKSHQFFVLHTHPEEYVNSMGEYMGAIEHHGRTIALDVGNSSQDTTNVLFSQQDVRLFARNAREIFAVANQNPQMDLSIFYDRSNRIFRNWVQHPYGMAEMRVYLDPLGNTKKVEIDYGLKNPNQSNFGHISQANSLRAMHPELKAPIEVNEVNIFYLESGVPYVGR